MNKLTAHTVLVLFDLLAIYGSYYVFGHWYDLTLLIENEINRVEIQSGIGVYFMLLIIPITHLTSFIKWPSDVSPWISKGLIVIFSLLIMMSIFISIKFTEKIEHAGYFYCKKDSNRMTLSEFRIFTKVEALCTK